MIIICIATDVFPELALVYELPESDLMSRPPRPRSAHIVNWKLILQAWVFVGMIEAFVSFFLFFAYFSENGISPSELFLAFDAFQGQDATGKSLRAVLSDLLLISFVDFSYFFARYYWCDNSSSGLFFPLSLALSPFVFDFVFFDFDSVIVSPVSAKIL